jgi:hypothetical protein
MRSTKLQVDAIQRMSNSGIARHEGPSPQALSVVGITSLGKDPNAGTPVELTFNDQCYIDASNATPVSMHGNNGAYDFVFSATQIRRVTITQNLLLESSGDKPGSFESVFKDLAKASRGREDTDFSILIPEIEAEATRSDEAFDAFGVKFPSDQVTRWGMAVLLGVQLYFVMYLRRLKGKLKSDDPGWDVPWMAMDESDLARVMLGVSIVGLPICAALFIVYRGAGSPGGSIVQRVLLGVGLVANVILSCLSWRYRPKVTEPVAPTQLFE